MQFRRLTKRAFGFTLLEMMISIAIFSIIVVIMASLIVQSQQQQRNLLFKTEMSQNSKVVMDSLVTELNAIGQGIHCDLADPARGQPAVCAAGPYQIVFNADRDMGEPDEQYRRGAINNAAGIDCAWVPSLDIEPSFFVYHPSIFFGDLARNTGAETVHITLDWNTDGFVTGRDREHHYQAFCGKANISTMNPSDFTLRKVIYGWNNTYHSGMGSNCDTFPDVLLTTLRAWAGDADTYPNDANGDGLPDRPVPLFQYWGHFADSDGKTDPESEQEDLWADFDATGFAFASPGGNGNGLLEDDEILRWVIPDIARPEYKLIRFVHYTEAIQRAGYWTDTNRNGMPEPDEYKDFADLFYDGTTVPGYTGESIAKKNGIPDPGEYYDYNDNGKFDLNLDDVLTRIVITLTLETPEEMNTLNFYRSDVNRNGRIDNTETPYSYHEIIVQEEVFVNNPCGRLADIRGATEYTPTPAPGVDTPTPAPPTQSGTPTPYTPPTNTPTYTHTPTATPTPNSACDVWLIKEYGFADPNYIAPEGGAAIPQPETICFSLRNGGTRIYTKGFIINWWDGVKRENDWDDNQTPEQKPNLISVEMMTLDTPASSYVTVWSSAGQQPPVYLSSANFPSGGDDDRVRANETVRFRLTFAPTGAGTRMYDTNVIVQYHYACSARWASTIDKQTFGFITSNGINFDEPASPAYVTAYDPRAGDLFADLRNFDRNHRYTVGDDIAFLVWDLEYTGNSTVDAGYLNVCTRSNIDSLMPPVSELGSLLAPPQTTGLLRIDQSPGHISTDGLGNLDLSILGVSQEPVNLKYYDTVRASWYNPVFILNPCPGPPFDFFTCCREDPLATASDEVEFWDCDIAFIPGSMTLCGPGRNRVGFSIMNSNRILTVRLIKMYIHWEQDPNCQEQGWAGKGARLKPLLSYVGARGTLNQSPEICIPGIDYWLGHDSTNQSIPVGPQGDWYESWVQIRFDPKASLMERTIFPGPQPYHIFLDFEAPAPTVTPLPTNTPVPAPGTPTPTATPSPTAAPGGSADMSGTFFWIEFFYDVGVTGNYTQRRCSIGRLSSCKRTLTPTPSPTP